MRSHDVRMTMKDGRPLLLTVSVSVGWVVKGAEQTAAEMEALAAGLCAGGATTTAMEVLRGLTVDGYNPVPEPAPPIVDGRRQPPPE